MLLDSRCPLLHYPPSLRAYLADRKVVLVLTKVDISGPVRAEAWTQYLKKLSPGSRVVQVESYTRKEASGVHQGRAHYEPHLPQTFRERLVAAIQEVHTEMLEPPINIKCDAGRLARWKPLVKRVIDWPSVLNAQGGKVGTAVGGAAVPWTSQEEDSPESVDDVEPEFLTIGLIGQSEAVHQFHEPESCFLFSRPAKCWKIISPQCAFRCLQGSGIKNSRKGAFKRKCRYIYDRISSV